MSTTIGKIYTEGIFEHSIEVYVGVQHVNLFVQDGSDRDGIGTKILLDEEKTRKLIEYLELAQKVKGWGQYND